MLLPLFVWPGLHTKLPITSVIGPGVPANIVPLITSPSIWKNAAPLLRSTAASPSLVVQANVPLSMSATGLTTSCAVMTPTMDGQCTPDSLAARGSALLPPPSWHAARIAVKEASTSDSSAVKTYFITNLLSIWVLASFDQPGCRVGCRTPQDTCGVFIEKLARSARSLEYPRAKNEGEAAWP